jgi:hypothetical protein
MNPGPTLEQNVAAAVGTSGERHLQSEQGVKRRKMLHATMRAVANCVLARRWMTHHTLVVPAAVALLAAACGAPPPKAVQEEVVAWKNLGQWSGRGNTQTESFIGLTGALRMHWRTKNETPEGSGTFRLILQSAISGRPLQETVDQKGPGEGTAYAAEDPRAFYILVESANLDWSFTVEEAVFGRRVEGSKQPH